MTRKILVVDDEESIRESLSKVLRAEGYEVELAENGQEAIEKMIREPMDLLLLDIGLPVKDGWSTLDWLNLTNSELPVILITGRWMQGERAEAAGAPVLMEKPLDVPKLLQYIRELLEEPPEARARRLQDHKRGFRQAPCDTKALHQQLLKRFTAPFHINDAGEKKRL